ncbi:hypothetical protein [Asaia bogorensis]|uniref:hypothetical protein n=1 Tax=Asaia bogorensis TaxID=91915 RepID=UPI0013CF336A|nr:hypothetical protein [Asaia bogorensis]
MNWLISFINSVEARTSDCNFDIILGASNEEEYRRFARLVPSISKSINIIIVNIDGYISRILKSDEVLARYRHNTDHCVVNIKKFVLLKWAYEQGYKRISSIDGDTAAVRDLSSVFDAMEENYHKEILVGSCMRLPDISSITATCLRHFEGENTNDLKNADGDIIYTWFFDAPYYAGTDLGEFFDYLSDRYGSLAKFLETICYQDFEHQIFHYWLHIKKGHKVFDFKFITDNFKPEACLYTHLLSIRDHCNYSPVWVYTWEYLHQPDIVDGFPTVYMLSHFDRMGLF